MIVEYILLFIFFTAGISLFLYSRKKFRRRQRLRAWSSFTSSSVFLLAALIIAVFVFDQGTFQRLTKEHAVATIHFKSIAKHKYQAVITAARTKPMELELHGDQWQMDARIIKWKGAAAWLGLQPLYRLERISGRYNDLNKEQSSAKSVHGLIDNAEVSLWNFMVEHQDSIPWLDAYYGSATYMPMTNDARFIINVTDSGLLARPRNQQATDSLKNWLAS